jgi:hypothetical protein
MIMIQVPLIDKSKILKKNILKNKNNTMKQNGKFKEETHKLIILKKIFKKLKENLHSRMRNCKKN